MGFRMFETMFKARDLSSAFNGREHATQPCSSFVQDYSVKERNNKHINRNVIKTLLRLFRRRTNIIIIKTVKQNVNITIVYMVTIVTEC